MRFLLLNTMFISSELTLILSNAKELLTEVKQVKHIINNSTIKSKTDSITAIK